MVASDAVRATYTALLRPEVQAGRLSTQDYDLCITALADKADKFAFMVRPASWSVECVISLTYACQTVALRCIRLHDWQLQSTHLGISTDASRNPQVTLGKNVWAYNHRCVYRSVPRRSDTHGI